MIIDINKIEKLLKSDITSYQICKATGIATQSLDNYRKYDSKLENMRLGIALKLYDYAKQIL
ncbi:hypothetical protein [Aerococcus urinae]|uniref:XRE family transcriptional regulator n=1 Tax=Aerococcus urinae TaxID=1376 RepID=A0A0X8FEM1_9LACT|nr:hypothetical protein [Aerococcus urinae]AMB95909.1 hypothetical protein AWM73_05035 [Aerococcus urinae]MCY3032495.1 hypothetical protein [Aerococcus urinae]MCY3038453.1 hypothetical protein [Aerococcus urinae]MCY3044541.1 hypothetical protein [Aerococcus urinae]MCY3046958.1 hypothetical protein [Aerococcus urinae]